MRILIITHAAGTPEVGPNMRTFYLGRKLVQRGHRVDIVGSGHFHKYRYSPLTKGQYTTCAVEGVHYHWLPTYNYKKRNYQQVLNQFDFVRRLWQYRKKWRSLKPDLVLFSSPPPLAALPAARLARKMGVPFIFEERDIWPMGLLDVGKLKARHPYVRLLQWVEKKAYRQADAIVSVKKGDYRYYQKYFPEYSNKYQFIPNGFDAETGEDPAAPALEKEKFLFGYVGAFSHVYNMELLLQAARMLKERDDIHFKLVGSGEDLQKIKDLAQSWGLQNVSFTGAVPKGEVLHHLRQFDVALISLRSTPAYKYGISANKMFEYMYARKPILAVYDTDFDDVQDAGCGVTLREPGAEELAHQMEKLADKPAEELQEMGEKGYQYFQQHYTFSSIADRYESLFAKLT